MDKQTLYRFFEGETSFEEEEGVRKWLESSPEHQKELLKERRLYDSMILLGDEKKIKEREANKHTSLRTTLLKIAAIIALTLGMNHLYSYFTTEKEEIPLLTITVPSGQRINLTLPDGSDVWLNARTTIKFPSVFKGSKREVQLDGEAYFDVTKNEKHPFVVQTEKANIEVLGTQFNVDAYTGKEEFETTLMSGRVKIKSRINTADALTLTPDKKAILENGKLKIIPVADYNPYRWKEGLICFKNETFRDIMDDFEKYYGINIHIENKQILKYYYTGKFRQTDGIDYALRVLQKDICFNYERDDDNRIIYIK